MEKVRIFASQNLSINYFNIIRIMAYVIGDDCVSCGTCEAECPNEAISQGAEHYEINPDSSVDCGTCADVCPTGAISQG